MSGKGAAGQATLVWVCGASGLLGRELCKTLQQQGIAFWATGREADIGNEALLRQLLDSKPGVQSIVNCAAFTNLDLAENQAAVCRRVNVDGDAILARIACELGAGFVQLSSDYVFGDGELALQREAERSGFTETDPVAPLSVYGASKADGEQAVLAANPQSIILRTAWLYGDGGSGFVPAMLAAFQKHQAVIKVVDDQWGSPTWVRDVAQLIVALVRGDVCLSPGLYHASAEGFASRYELACELLSWANQGGRCYTTQIVPVSTHQLVQPDASGEMAGARRPRWSVLSKQKLSTVGKYSFPDWKTSLQTWLQE